MLQTCSIIAQLIVDTLIDDDIGFSDFLYSEKPALEQAIQTHWHYMAQQDSRFKDPTAHNTLYKNLIVFYTHRTSKPVNIDIYRAYVRLLVDTELRKLPIFARAA